MISLSVAVSVMSGLPFTASAATGMATVDVSMLGGTDAGNSEFADTQSQWTYNGTSKELWLNTAGGIYTLTGTNGCIRVLTGASDMNVILSGLNITAPDAHGKDTIRISNACTLTLSGANTLISNEFNALLLEYTGACIITGNGSLTATSYAFNGIFFSTGSALSIIGNAAVTAVGSVGGMFGDAGLFMGASESVFIGGIASLTIVNNRSFDETHNFKKAGGAAGDWKLTDAVTVDPLTGDSVTVTFAPGQPGTVAREYTLVPGDANIDGYVDILDTAEILRYAAGRTVLGAQQLLNGEVDGDGAVDCVDALLILKYVIGVIDKFPVE